MARGSRGPANDPLTMLQQQIDQLTDRVRELETKRVLTAPVNSLDKTRDPVDGEHMVDHRDGTQMWRLGNEWRYGLPVASFAANVQEIAFEPAPEDREFQLLVIAPPLLDFASSELFYLDEDFPTRIFVKTPGTYMGFLHVSMSNADGFHSALQLGLDGTGLAPDGITSVGFNNWLGTFQTLASTGDPNLSPSLQDDAIAPALQHMLIGSFASHSESILDFQYEQDNPDDDEEVPFPSYTRWFTAAVRNDGPDAINVNAVITIMRISNRQLA